MATPFAGVQAPSVYRHKVGAFEITVLSDGNLALEATVFDAPVSTRISFSPVLMSRIPPDVGPPASESRRRRC
jgi:hypothetical protein